MDQSGKELLYMIIDTHAPSGSEQRLQRTLHEWASGFADEVIPDVHGNLDVILNPQAPFRVMLAGHCDNIGFLVMRIVDGGFIKLDAVGGLDDKVLLGASMCIYGPKGRVPGVIGKAATHNENQNERTQVPKLEDLWVDIGADSKEAAEELVRVGDFASFTPNITELEGERISAPALDNALGLWVVMETARRCSKQRSKLNVALHCVSTVQEEVGSRGAESAARTIEPRIAIAVDTTHALDDPGHGEKRTSIRIRLAGGPAIARGPNSNPVLVQRLKETANTHSIKVQMEPNPDLEANDSKPLQVAGGGAASATIGIPIRNMHTQVEVADLSDAENAVQLLTQMILELPRELSLLPIALEDEDDGMQRATPGKGSGRLALDDRAPAKKTDPTDNSHASPQDSPARSQ